MRFNVRDRVCDKADQRHVGRIKTICRRPTGDICTIRWEETGWLSTAILTEDLILASEIMDHRYGTRPDSAPHRSPINILQAALECDDGEAALSLIQDALGIEDGGVAAHAPDNHWPEDRKLRSLVIAEWIGTDLQYFV